MHWEGAAVAVAAGAARGRPANRDQMLARIDRMIARRHARLRARHAHGPAGASASCPTRPVKHMIIISDGDPAGPQLRADRRP